MTEYGRIHTDGSRSGGQPVIKTQHCPNCEATEQKLHDFRQEVSDVVGQALSFGDVESLRRKGVLSRFIIPKPKPDPLVAALEGVTFDHYPPNDAETIRAALDALGFEIREKNDD